jgi:hypothetical protein
MRRLGPVFYFADNKVEAGMEPPRLNHRQFRLTHSFSFETKVAMNTSSATGFTRHKFIFWFAVLLMLCLTDTAQAAGALNDTGVTTCSDGTYVVACSTVDATHPGQDASHGRDAAAATASLSKIGSGPAGFDFTKLNVNGVAVPDAAVRDNANLAGYACVHDNVTNLTWNLRNEGLENIGWYDPNFSTNGGNVGFLSSNSTHYLTVAENAGNVCGFSDWRIPTVRELLSIVDMDTGFRPNGYFAQYPSGCGERGYVWSSQTYKVNNIYVWLVGQDGAMAASDKTVLSLGKLCISLPQIC